MNAPNTPQHRISVVMPMRNAGSTVAKTIASLLEQKPPFDELIVVDDASTDASIAIVESMLAAQPHKHLIIRHPKSIGLASSYNDGIQHSSGDLVVTLHSDVVLVGETALTLLITPLLKHDSVVATYHHVDHPLDIWSKYNFWQKCFFARQAGVRQHGMDGKFDCFSRATLLAVGMFDGETFRRAGEDGDIIRKLSRKGKVVQSDAIILHLHSLDPHFGVREIFFKHAQYAEAQGAICRRYGLSSPLDFVRTFFREILVATLFLPWLRIAGIALICLYAFAYCRRLYASEWRNPRVLLIPFINIALLGVSVVFSLRGFLRGRQTL